MSLKKYFSESTYTPLTQYAPVVLRIGIGLVMLWFGIQQITDTANWIGYLPLWSENFFISQTNLIYLNGFFEIIAGTCLLIGYKTRIAALLLTVHMLEIIHVVGYDATGVRDTAIAIATLAIALYGPDRASLDKKI